MHSTFAYSIQGLGHLKNWIIIVRGDNDFLLNEESECSLNPDILPKSKGLNSWLTIFLENYKRVL